MATETTGEIDVQSYQQFWEDVAIEQLDRFEGKCVALEFGKHGWKIIESADTLDQLRKCVHDAGVDTSKVVFDQIHREDATAPLRTHPSRIVAYLG